MKINFSNKTNFTATKLDYSPKLVKLNPETSKYEEANVSLAEIDFYNPKDIQALKDTDKKWEYALLAYNIMLSAQEQNKSIKLNGTPEEQNLKIRAITTQEKDFENLDYRKILALCEFVEKRNKGIYIRNLQIDPEIKLDTHSEYKKVGTSFLNSCKNYYNTIALRPLPSKDVINFYKQNQFRFSKRNPDILVWKKA